MRQLPGPPALFDPFLNSGAQIPDGSAGRLLVEICHEQRLCGTTAVTARDTS